MPSEYIPTPKTKMMPCKRCGVAIEVGWKTKKAPQHLECGIKAAMDQHTQMSNHSGPYYEAWLAKMREHFAN